MNLPRGILSLPPNRVWRSYLGGRTLDAIASAAAPADSNLAEDWIASTTPAINPGRDRPGEGLSRVALGDGSSATLAELFAADPHYYLGAAHHARFGPSAQVLVKFLDSATRLHFQVHPTREFARARLGVPSGKTEAYHVLGVRPGLGGPAVIHAGFRRPVTREELRAMIERQDIAAIKDSLWQIPVRPGDTFLIPGGTPHALGAGLFLVEIQEPSDLVVRFEFERAGQVLPEAARFMGRGLDFCLDVFDREPLAESGIESRLRCSPRRLRDLGPAAWQHEWIGPDRTDCFRVRQTHLAAPVEKAEDGCHIAIVTDGAVVVDDGVKTHRFRRYETFFVPAAAGPLRYTPDPQAVILECGPPDPVAFAA